MPTLTQTSSETRQRSELRYWIEFGAKFEAGIEELFEVFVALDQEESQRSRTLIWPAVTPHDDSIAHFIEQYFRTLFGSSDFSLSKSIKERRLDFVISKKQSSKSEQSLPRNDSLRSSLVESLGFARFDLRTDDGICAITFRSISPDTCELAVLMEEALQFEADLFPFILQSHAVSALRGSEHVDFSELLQFVNADWNSQ